MKRYKKYKKQIYLDALRILVLIVGIDFRNIFFDF